MKRTEEILKQAHRSCNNRKVSCSGRRQASEHHLATALTYVTGSHNNFTRPRGTRYVVQRMFPGSLSFSFAREKKRIALVIIRRQDRPGKGEQVITGRTDLFVVTVTAGCVMHPFRRIMWCMRSREVIGCSLLKTTATMTILKLIFNSVYEFLSWNVLRLFSCLRS